MKKVLFVLGAFAAMSLASCSGKQDCACAIVDSEGAIFVCSADYEENANYNVGTSLDVKDFEGECTDVKWTDLTGSQWGDMGTDFVLKCKEM